MHKADGLTNVERNRLTSKKLDPESRKHNNLVVKRKFRMWLNHANDAFLILNIISNSKIKKLLNENDAHILIKITSRILNLLEFDQIGAQVDFVKDLEFVFDVLEPFAKTLNQFVREANDNQDYRDYKFRRMRKEDTKEQDKILDENPFDLNAWLCKAKILVELEYYEEAVNCYDKAIEIDPFNWNAFYGKGISLGKMCEYEQAIHCFDKAIEIDPKIWLSLLHKGLFLENLGRYMESIECFDKIIENDPNHIHAWRYKADLLKFLGNNVEAKKIYDAIFHLVHGSGENFLLEHDLVQFHE